MQKFLFRNRWFALGWAVLTLVSIGAFFSEGGGHTRLDEAAADIREQKQAMARLADGDPEPAPTTPVVEDPVDALTPDGEAADDMGDEADESGRPVRLVRANVPAAADDEEALPDDEADTYVVLDKSAPIPDADY